MKKNFFKGIFLPIICLLLFSCSKESDSSSSSEGSSTSTTQTWLKLTAINSSGTPMANYNIMMFDQPVTSTSVLPPIKMQVKTDINGLAFFDLNSMIITNTPTKYYFEAFIPNGSNYVWRSVTHPSYSIKKADMITSSIIVN